MQRFLDGIASHSSRLQSMVQIFGRLWSPIAFLVPFLPSIFLPSAWFGPSCSLLLVVYGLNSNAIKFQTTNTLNDFQFQCESRRVAALSKSLLVFILCHELLGTAHWSQRSQNIERDSDSDSNLNSDQIPKRGVRCYTLLNSTDRYNENKDKKLSSNRQQD